MKKISIRNLKDVKQLDFVVPEQKGVYLIAGANGCGKTTLLICLDRICNSLAFSLGLSSASSWDEADQYEESLVTYTVETKTVSYKKRQARWAPTPKKDSSVLDDFGFSASSFIKADAQRIAVRPEELKAGNLTNVDNNVKIALNDIFETDKYNRLMRLKNSNGRGKTTVYFYLIKEKNGSKYYSEKRFSTGELAIVRLVEQIEQVENGSMILLDEAELALHPRVQVKLLEYLEKKAQLKNLWVFISTHSPTMLKATKKENILLLKKEEEKTQVINPCYAAHAIGEVDFANSNIFDYIFFVEDEKAVDILRAYLKRYFAIYPEHATAIYNIIPVGGFYETSRMAVYTNRRVFGDTKIRAVVDQDAFEDIGTKPKFEELYKYNKGLIKSLSFTPEVWLIDKLEKADVSLKKKILDEYYIEWETIIKDAEYVKCSASNPRNLAKKKYNVLLDVLNSTTCRAKEKIDSDFIQLVISSLPDAQIEGIVKPILD